jgi:hypothetical protein
LSPSPKAAVITIQLMQARNGGQQPVHMVLAATERAALTVLNQQLESRTKRESTRTLVRRQKSSGR